MNDHAFMIQLSFDWYRYKSNKALIDIVLIKQSFNWYRYKLNKALIDIVIN